MSIYDKIASPTKPKKTIYDNIVTKAPAPQPPTASKIGSAVSSAATAIKNTLVPQTPVSLYDQVQPKTTTIQKIAAPVIAGVKGAISGFNNTPTTPKTFDLVSGVGNTNAFTAAHDAFTQGVNQISDELVKTADSSQPTLARNVALGSAAVHAINTTFGVLLSPFQAYASVPVIGNVLDGVNKIFGAIGEGGGSYAAEIVHQLPIAQSTKAAITPLIHDAGALVAQLIAGKALDAGGAVAKDHILKLSDNSKAIMTELSNDPAIQHAIAESQKPVPEQTAPPTTSEIAKAITEKMPNLQHARAYDIAERANEMAKQGDTSEKVQAFIQKELATIDPKSVPTFPTENTRATAADTTPGLAANEAPRPIEASQVQTARSVQPAKAPSEAAKPLQTTPGVSKIGKSIEVKAIEDKLTDGFKGTAGYDTITIKDQAERATKLITENIDDARAVIRGDKPLPDGLKGTSLITAMEEHIKANSDGQAAYELANSPLVSETSAAAQELRLAAERVPDSITAKFNEIKAARKATVEKRGGVKNATKAVKDDIKKEVKAAASKRVSWEAFIKEVQCSY